MTVRRILSVSILAAVGLMAAPAAHTAAAEQSTYKGWKTLQLKNDLVELQIAPALGGRIVQYKLGDFEHLWVNDDLAGKTPTQTGVGPDGAWLNWGGDKLWPAPQGWSGPAEWPGPPGPVPNAEGLPYKARIVETKGAEAAVELTGPKDQYAGIRFSRKIRMYSGSTRVSIESTMTNVDTKPRRWGIWSITQIDCESPEPPGYKRNVRAFCPINPKSVYDKGYKLLYGAAGNPAWQPDADDNLMRVHYVRQVGKVGLDSTAGWLAVVDGKTGDCMVQRFKCFPEKKYPDGASVEFWINAPGKIKTGDTEVEIADDLKATPPYLEAEVLSPFADLKPGESYTFQNDWYACNIGGDYPILECTDVGVVCRRVRAWSLSGLAIDGLVGVFYPGRLGLAFFDSRGRQMGRVMTKMEVSPERLVVLDFQRREELGLNPPIPTASGRRATHVALFLTDMEGDYLGELVREQINYSVNRQ